MKSFGVSFSRFLAGLIVGSLIAFGLSGIVVRALRRQTATPKPLPFLKQGFDFRTLRSGSDSWIGPAIGEKIDLTSLKARDGSGIATLFGRQPVMLASINPACGMCRVARDEMLFISQHLVPQGVKYYAVCFSPIDSSVNFYEYAKSIGFPDPAFEWQGAVSPSPTILNMTVPSHVLVDREGTVLQVWPGSNADEEVRRRMGLQIVDDTLIISETFQAVSHLPKDSKPQ